MRVLRWGALALLLAAAVAPASAADLSPETWYQPRPAVVVFRWTGVHIGLHGGGALGFKELTPVPFNIFINGNPNPCPTPSPTFPGCGVIAPSPSSIGVGGVILGGQAGGDYQIENWVLGIEGDASWTRASGSTPCTGVGSPAGAAVGAGSCTAKLDNLGTVAVRAGYAFDRLLVYAKGGAAWTDDNYQVKFPTASSPLFVFSANELRWGWVAGVGVEYAFTDSWTAKIEYNYMDLGADALRFVEQGGAVFMDTNVRERMNVVKLGVNYRFGPNPILIR